MAFHFLIGYVMSVLDTEEFAETELSSQMSASFFLSTVMVHVSNAYKDMDMARKCISLMQGFNL